MRQSRLVPELLCADFECSLRFYRDVLGFAVLYARPEERFAFLEREGAQIMLEQPTDPARTWVAAPLEHPYGRGLNLQIQVTDVESLYATVVGRSGLPFVPLEERWYRRDDVLLGSRQFVVQDPDGYLLRFFADMGARPIAV